MSDGEIGLAGTRRTDAENQFGPFQSAHVGVLGRRSRDDSLLAGRNLRHGELGFALHRRQAQLIVCGDRHADRAFNVGSLHAAAFLEFLIEVIECTPRLVGGDNVSRDNDGIAARSSVDVETLFKQLEVLVKLTEQLTGEPIVLERQNKVIGVARNAWVAR